MANKSEYPWKTPPRKPISESDIIDLVYKYHSITKEWPSKIFLSGGDYWDLFLNQSDSIYIGPRYFHQIEAVISPTDKTYLI